VVRAACDSDATAVVVATDDDDNPVGFRRLPGPPAVGGHLRAAGVPVIMLQTADADGHAPARALYESVGFRRLPTVQYWLEGRRADDRHQ
jgi:hypothetical protein